MWVRLDDRFWMNPKMEQAGWAARGLHAAAMSYCGDILSDGHLTARDIARMTAGEECGHLIDILVEIGAWHVTDDGWAINDFLEFNPTRDEVVEEKAKKRRAANARWNKARNASAHAPASTSADANEYADPTRPDVSTDVDTHTPTTAEPPNVEPIDHQLCETLRDAIATHTGNRLKIGKAWATDMSRLRRLGPSELETPQPKDPDEIRAAIRFLFTDLATPGNDGFCWANVTQSPAKLRKNWLKLEAAYNRRHTNPPHTRKHPSDMLGVDMAFALLEQKDPAA